MFGLLFWIKISQNIQKTVRNICIQGKFILQLIINIGLALTRFRTTRPCLQQVNLTWARVRIENLHRDTGQRILCFHRCQLTITWTSNIKEGRSKPRLHFSVKLLAGVWQPFCATPSVSPSFAHTHKQYH